MNLYSLTLQKSSAIPFAVFGNFTDSKYQEIVVSNGKTLELFREMKGKLKSIFFNEVFGIIRSLNSFRLIGGNQDYLIIGSDSGKITILEWNDKKNTFIKAHEETFGKSGCRRIVPGQFLASDPRGRSVMIGAIEKQKLVYILNRDNESRLTISSPLAAHKTNCISFDMVGVDVGFDNPIFAVLEVDYEEVKWEENNPVYEKFLTYYELDLGLNHVVRKMTQPVDQTANKLIAVPGDEDGPGGVLVCSENHITWMNLSTKKKFDPVTIRIPRREGTPKERTTLIVNHALHKAKGRTFFFLVQTEYGDVFKITLEFSEDVVNRIDMLYFDTVPVSTSLCLLKNGFLFVAAEQAEHGFYRIKGMGDSNDVCATNLDELSFTPRTILKNLAPSDTLQNISPLIQSKLIDLFGEESPQFYSLCGKSSGSTLRIMRHGIAVTEPAVSELPANAKRIWTLKTKLTDVNDSYIIISFLNATLVLSVQGSNVSESTDSGLMTDVPTIHIDLIGEDSYLQVTPYGLRHVKSNKRISEWKCPGKKTVVNATSNGTQVLLALAGGEIYIFELDYAGNLSQVDRHEYGTEICSIAIAPVPSGIRKSKFVAVADHSNCIKILSLDENESNFEMKSILTVDSKVSSMCLSYIVENGNKELLLHLGQENGVLQRSSIEEISGKLTDTRKRFVGRDPVKLFPIKISEEAEGVLALSSRTWIIHSDKGKVKTLPLSYVQLDWAHSFATGQGDISFVSISKNSLRVLSLEDLSSNFNQTVVPLRYTPRKLTVHMPTQTIVIVESEMGVTSVPEDQLKARLSKQDDSVETIEKNRRIVGPTRVVSKNAKWCGALRLYDPRQNKTLCLVELGNNEAFFSVTTCQFSVRKSEGVFVIVGGARSLTYSPKGCVGGFLDVFKIEDSQLQLVHRTEVEDVPMAVAAFHGRLLVGIGKILRIYDIGKKKLLRKCEYKLFPRNIVTLHVQGYRIFVGDMTESFFLANYNPFENRLDVVADDTFPRWIISSEVIDYDTITGSDKFGNIFISRLPQKVSLELKEETGDKLRFAPDLNGGAPFKFEEICQFHVGEIVTSLHKGSLVPGGLDSIIFSTIYGGIGALHPFVSREDVDFFSHLEMHMRTARPPLCGRDHLAFRSFYFPVKNVIDGDLCEQFALLEPTKQREIAQEIGERTPAQILKKLEDIRQLMN